MLHFDTIPEISRLNYKFRDAVKQFKEKGEYWQVITEEAEKLAEENECHEINRVCLESGNKTFFDKYIISRPCWKEQISYQCYSEPQDGCKHLKSQGCQLENSNCCVGRFVNPVTDICWKCLFPISIAGVKIASSPMNDTSNPRTPICFCPRPGIPVPVSGIPVGF